MTVKCYNVAMEWKIQTSEIYVETESKYHEIKVQK